MQRSIRLADTVGAVSGVVFVLLLFVSVAAVDPQLGVTDQELLDWWADEGNRNSFIVSKYTLLAACPFLLVFVSRLRARLQGGDEGGWAEVFFASGIVATAALGICAIARGVIAMSMRFDEEPLPGVDTLRFSTSLAMSMWDVAILFVGVSIAIASILALSYRSLPRWIGWLGLPVALGCVVLVASGSASFAIPLIIVWVLLSSVHIGRSTVRAPSAGPALTSEVSSAQI